MQDRVKLAVTMAKRDLIDSIWKSVMIEGLPTTFPDTEMICSNLKAEATPEEVLFIINMKNAWKFILDTLGEPVTLPYLRQINSICGNNLIYGCGAVRTNDVTIKGCKYKPEIPMPYDIEDELKSLLTFDNKQILAIIMFMYLARRQIFIDGNKRVAQLIANKILIENGIGHLYFEQDKIKDFTNHLCDYYETANHRTMLLYMLDNCIFRI